MQGRTGTRLVLWRHGRTEWNASGRFQGQTDIALDEVGLSQAAAAAPALAAMRPSAIWASPLSRAQATADALSALLPDVPRHVDARLAEIHVGDWSGMTPADMAEVDPNYEVALREGTDFRRSASGETATETGARMAEALHEIVAAHRGETVVVASHGLAIRMGLGTFLGWDWETTWWLAGLKNCHWVTLAEHFPGTDHARFRLEAYNVGAQ